MGLSNIQYLTRFDTVLLKNINGAKSHSKYIACFLKPHPSKKSSFPFHEFEAIIAIHFLATLLLSIILTCVIYRAINV